MQVTPEMEQAGVELVEAVQRSTRRETVLAMRDAIRNVPHMMRTAAVAAWCNEYENDMRAILLEREKEEGA
jgi:hypothetical protein